MVKRKIAALALICLLASGCRPDYSWKCISADGSRTGVTCTTAGNIVSALGVIDSLGAYHAPCGRVFEAGSLTAAEAGILIGLQPEMSDLKQTVGYVPETMYRRVPLSGLCDMVADCLREGASEICGGKVDVAFINKGGVRVDFHQGELTLDDVRSLLPFKNFIVVAAIKGSSLRSLFSQMAREGVQAFSGARVVVRDKSLASLEVGGKPVEDNRIYTLATVDFLLDGGDGYRIADLVEKYTVTSTLVADPIMDHILSLSKAGRPVAQKPDGRLELL